MAAEVTMAAQNFQKRIDKFMTDEFMTGDLCKANEAVGAQHGIRSAPILVSNGFGMRNWVSLFLAG